MTMKQAGLLAAEMILDSTNIILQASDEKDTYIFKLHKLQCPNVRITLAFNGVVKSDKEMDLGEAFPILCEAILYTSKLK